MGAAVSITRLDLTASELRKATDGEKNSAAARRILALALVLDGVDRMTATEPAAWIVRPGSRLNLPSWSRPAPTPRHITQIPA